MRPLTDNQRTMLLKTRTAERLKLLLEKHLRTYPIGRIALKALLRLCGWGFAEGWDLNWGEGDGY